MKKIFLHILIISFFVALITPGFSQVKPKRIGFALSGGGAKGLAHIGVLKVFEEAGIYPDVITGTSMGSVVGGLYAIGYSSMELDSLARALNWPEYFTDTYDRGFRTIEEKEDVERYIFSFPIKSGKIQLPKGFVDGQKLTLLLSGLTQKVHGVKSFDDFKIPFRCIGGDLETGEAVVFDSGFLPDAIRASIGIPSVFEPLEIDGKMVVDGMIVRNLPVQDAFDMGADIVIAVDVGSGLYNREELSSIITVLDQTSSYRIVQSNLQQLALANAVVRPDLGTLSALDFNQADSLILAGEIAAKAMLPEIQKLLAGNYQTLALPKKSIEKPPKEVAISKVEIIGLVGVDEKTFLKILQIKEGKTYEVEDIARKVDLVAATGFYNKMSYRLVSEADGLHLKIRADRTDNIAVQIGANYHSTFNAGLLLNATIRNALLQGTKFSIDLRISENPAIRANYLYYTKTRPNIGLRLSSFANLYPGFLYLDNTLIDEYDILKTMARLDIFSGLGRNTSIGLGASIEYSRLDKRFFDLESRSPSINKLTGHFNFNFDNFNRKYFPTKGTQIRLSGNLVFDGALRNTEADDSEYSNRYNNYNLFTFRQLLPINKHLVIEWYNWAGISRFKETDFTQLFYLGRSLPYVERYIPFSGLNYMERPTGDFAFSGLKFQLEPHEGLFAALSYNYGYFKTPAFTYIDDTGYNSRLAEKGIMSGIGLEIGALSNFGPISLTSEFNLEEKQFNFLFQMGFQF